MVLGRQEKREGGVGYELSLVSKVGVRCDMCVYIIITTNVDRYISVLYYFDTMDTLLYKTERLRQPGGRAVQKDQNTAVRIGKFIRL